MPPKRSLAVSTRKNQSTLSASFKRPGAKPSPSTAVVKPSTTPTRGSTKSEDEKRADESQDDDLDPEDEAWDSIWYRTKNVMGGRPVHAADQNRIRHILRTFDLDPSYGPCIGLTRMERWQRAYDLGLNPPDAIRSILHTNTAKSALSDCVFSQHGL